MQAHRLRRLVEVEGGAGPCGDVGVAGGIDDLARPDDAEAGLVGDDHADHPVALAHHVDDRGVVEDGDPGLAQLAVGTALEAFDVEADALAVGRLAHLAQLVAGAEGLRHDVVEPADLAGIFGDDAADHRDAAAQIDPAVERGADDAGDVAAGKAEALDQNHRGAAARRRQRRDRAGTAGAAHKHVGRGAGVEFTCKPHVMVLLMCRWRLSGNPRPGAGRRRRSGGYPLSPDRVMPLAKNCWVKTKMVMTGRTMTMAAAITRFQLLATSSAPTMLKMPSGSVYLLVSLR